MPERTRQRNAFDIVRSTTVIVFPVVLVIAGSHILNAHEIPGEGFTAGLLVAMSVLLLYVGVGYAEVEAALPRFTRWLMVAGLSLALVTGMSGLLRGKAFGTHVHGDVTVLGETLSLTSSAFFDLAIFLVVTGSVHGLFQALGRGEDRAR